MHKLLVLTNLLFLISANSYARDCSEVFATTSANAQFIDLMIDLTQQYNAFASDSYAKIDPNLTVTWQAKPNYFYINIQNRPSLNQGKSPTVLWSMTVHRNGPLKDSVDQLQLENGKINFHQTFPKGVVRLSNEVRIIDVPQTEGKLVTVFTQQDLFYQNRPLEEFLFILLLPKKDLMRSRFQ